MIDFIGKNKIFIFLLAGLILGWYYGVYFILTYILFAGAFLLGLLFGNWYSSKKKQNTLISIIAWSNLFAGILLPPLGVLVASTTYAFAQKVSKKEKNKFKVLWIIGVVITVINALVGVYIFSKHY